MQGFAFVGDDGQIYRFIGSKTMTKRQDEHDAAQERQRRESQERAEARSAAAAGRDRPEPRHSPEPEPQPVRGPADVLEDIQELVGGLPRLSPSGVETVAAKLAALVGELKAMQGAK